jgi:hypothetical protein
MSTQLGNDLMSTVDVLIRAFRAHMHGRSLPAPCMLGFSPLDRQMEVQPGGEDLVSMLGNLLLWAHTLTDVTATWRRIDSGRLHVCVTGRTTIGVRVRVYGGGLFSECAGLVALDPGQADGVSLDELYALACLLREMQVAHGGAGKGVA